MDFDIIGRWSENYGAMRYKIIVGNIVHEVTKDDLKELKEKIESVLPDEEVD